MFNPQSYAVSIEHYLTSKSSAYASRGDADRIRLDPIEYLDGVLKYYEVESETNANLSADFWDKYEEYKGKSIDEMGEDIISQLISDMKQLFD